MTSWKKTKQLDEYFFHRTTPEDRLVIEAQLLLDGDLRDTLRWQQRTYVLARQYGREQLRGEIRAAQHQLFHRPEYRSFQRMVQRLFSRS